MTFDAKKLAELYAAAGLPCQIEAGPAGLVVYTSSRARAATIARELARIARIRAKRVFVHAPAEDADEPKETRWWATVEFDWKEF